MGCLRMSVLETEAGVFRFLHPSVARPRGSGGHRMMGMKAGARRPKSIKKQSQKLGNNFNSAETDGDVLDRGLKNDDVPSKGTIEDGDVMSTVKNTVLNLNVASIDSRREDVLRACAATCAGIASAGFLIGQATHWAAEAGWSVSDSTLLYHVEAWHLEVMLGLVVIVSGARQLLLLSWHDFMESSNLANKQILGPLSPGDYVIVAVLPGISEELLFRGALLPLCGLDWKGATLTGILFGLLHLSGGRKMAFAVWASFVGILYGLACIATNSMVVPIVAHSVNNLVGATLWKLNEEKKPFDGDE